LQYFERRIRRREGNHSGGTVMSKFEMELELKGFKVRVKGERGDIPLIAQNIGKQFGDLMKPAANIVEEQKPQLQLPMQNAIDVPAASNTRRRRAAARSNGSVPAPVQIDVVIDALTWGAPQQLWTCADKAIWLLYATSKCGGPSEMTSADIARVFNARYRAAKTILPQNVNRDLTRLKNGTNALVGRNDKNDAWFLIDAGEKHAIGLITKAREQTTSTGG
jgi:hypothetical protein